MSAAGWHLRVLTLQKKMSGHKQIDMITPSGERVKALAPMIVSASRATDIPAFYADRFFFELENGYTTWRNPYNGRYSYISFSQTQFIVFWSKNPAPLLPFLNRLKERGIAYYIQYTLNDYEPDNLEPNVPELQYRIDTFRKLVDVGGYGSVIWRFDPLILTDKIDVDDLLEKIRRVGLLLNGYTEKLVFSFADISGYKKVGYNLRKAGINYREWTEMDMKLFARQLRKLNDNVLHLQLTTCAENIDLSDYDIAHNRCIDPDLISRLSSDNLALQMWLFGATKDKGQRKACGCILAKDIGAYNTCPHGCIYCYANSNPSTPVNKNPSGKTAISF